MINKINNNNIQNIFNRPENSKGHEKQAKSLTDTGMVQLQSVEVIEKAKNISEINMTSVEKAKQLLNSGQLDKPENIRQAAKNMIDFGI